MFRLLLVSSFSALAALFLFVWLGFLSFRSDMTIFFYLAPLGVALAFAEELVFRGILQKAVGTAAQIAFYIIYAAFVAAWFLPEGQMYFTASALPIALLATALTTRFGLVGAMWFRAFFLVFSLILLTSSALAFSVLLLLAPFALAQVRRKSIDETISALSLRWTGVLDGMLLPGLKLFVMMFVVLFVEGIVLNALGVFDTGNVAAVIRKQSLLGIAIAVILAPIAEEIFFRGYLQKQIGVLLSSALFAWLHVGYGSIAEIVAAFTVSIILGLWLRKSDNVYPCILAHGFYNIFSITAILVFAQA
jgi:membrane protease YdiL (CAAX protease family)